MNYLQCYYYRIFERDSGIKFRDFRTWRGQWLLCWGTDVWTRNWNDSFF